MTFTKEIYSDQIWRLFIEMIIE